MIKDSYKYIRQNFKEWFVVDVNEGYVIPRFYLPIERKRQTYQQECWIFYLAPFVLFYKINKNVFFRIWRDLIEFYEMLKNNKN